MAGQDRYIVAKRVEFVLDPAKQQVAIAARQIPAADPAGEKHISSDHEFILAQIEAETARTMAWHLEHLHFTPQEIACRCRLDKKPALWLWLNLQLEPRVAEEFGVGNHVARVAGMRQHPSFGIRIVVLSSQRRECGRSGRAVQQGSSFGVIPSSMSQAQAPSGASNRIGPSGGVDEVASVGLEYPAAKALVAHQEL